MTVTWAALLAFVAAAPLGAVFYALYMRAVGRGAHEQARAVLRAAEQEREQRLRTAEVDAKEILLRAQQEQDSRLGQERDLVVAQERDLRRRERAMHERGELVERRERELRVLETQVDEQQRRAAQARTEARDALQRAEAELEHVASLSREQARHRIMVAVEDEARANASVAVARIEDEARRDATERANRIVAGAVQRMAAAFVGEKTVSTVALTSDDMKGRIIGREGRNIRAFEAATGVDVIIDDTPEVVVLSAFDPIRREVAKVALERLMTDGRIHPVRIEEIVARVKEELEQGIVRVGEQAALELGLHGIHGELIRLVGRLRYQVIAGQNLWNHAVETASLAGMMAVELGMDEMLARRAGLLHDIGRAIDHGVDGAHPAVGADQARRYGERAEVVDAIAAHHESEPGSALAVLVQAADNLSKARPGARREALGTYVRRLHELERVAASFKGVAQAYALQAGRELRVMVHFDQVSDQEALLLSSDIARRIEDELTYPGEVRVTVVREARATEIAR